MVSIPHSVVVVTNTGFESCLCQIWRPMIIHLIAVYFMRIQLLYSMSLLHITWDAMRLLNINFSAGYLEYRQCNFNVRYFPSHPAFFIPFIFLFPWNLFQLVQSLLSKKTNLECNYLSVSALVEYSRAISPSSTSPTPTTVARVASQGLGISPVSQQSKQKSTRKFYPSATEYS